MVKTEKKQEKLTELKYAKEDILLSDEFSKVERDFLTAYLSDDEYTMGEAKKVLEKIRKGAVN